MTCILENLGLTQPVRPSSRAGLLQGRALKLTLWAEPTVGEGSVRQGGVFCTCSRTRSLHVMKLYIQLYSAVYRAVPAGTSSVLWAAREPQMSALATSDVVKRRIIVSRAQQSCSSWLDYRCCYVTNTEHCNALPHRTKHDAMVTGSCTHVNHVLVGNPQTLGSGVCINKRRFRAE